MKREASESEFDYFMRRARQEAEAASCASDLKARKAHREMAERYREVAVATEMKIPHHFN